MKIRFTLIVLLLFTFSGICVFAGKKAGSFAIVVDKEVMENCEPSIHKYAASVEADGLRTHVIVDCWNIPDSIREELYRLYRSDNLEGAVFIGNIPVPMIRNGQHLTTAFKMDQRRPWDQSSVPSDRFYDDFDLKFDYLKKDSVNELYHYYNLSAEGAQSVYSEIYSARIKPPVYDGQTRFELIDNYLEKVVREKQAARKISNITYFTGHGYNSNCMVSRADERIALTSQFVDLANGKGALNYIDHSYDDYVKHRLMAEMGREDLDLAMLHHHGADDAQLLNGSPVSSTASAWLEMSRKFFRGKIRSAKDSLAAKQYYIDNYNIPESWIDDVFHPEVVTRDSLMDASLDIHIEDLKDYKSGARFVMLDACFNGSFHLDDYISGHYIFNPGHTVVVKANSVNSLQDIWPYQLIGLLDLGVSVGNWAKELFTLESHLIGDPTYRYVSHRSDLNGLNEAMAHRRNDVKFWKGLLKDNNPEVEALAIKMLFHNGRISYEELYRIQTDNLKPTVRLMAYFLIHKKYNEMIVPSIKAGLYDSYELIRRFAARDAADNQSPLLLEDIIKLRLSPGISKRVDFQIKGATDVYPREAVLAAYDAELKGKEGIWYERKAQEREKLESSLSGTQADFEKLLDPAVESRNKRFTITALRNSNNVTCLDHLFRFMKESEDNDLKFLLAEALGWFTHSWKRDDIVAFCKAQAATESDEAVKNELLRTIRRLTD
ncbi:hypothetical protein [Proteiniphilum sp. X52]|uniref:hypothetical protein n=1 Tax=Proteiniphilum sp. X52 TaxID=2382159 RepID=UPI000F09BBA3|nr:hypothetical protein [Proteiniphilum sp. X52]RNC66861.1 hypothetical protein D7D25_00945 [Proteiniphilum sp. X52]